MKNELRNFLIAKDCHDAFVNNFKKQYGKIITLSNHLEKVNPSQYIRTAFIWDETEQGSVFWSNINKEWLSVLSDSLHSNSSSNS